jgi:hypothetical protein
MAGDFQIPAPPLGGPILAGRPSLPASARLAPPACLPPHICEHRRPNPWPGCEGSAVGGPQPGVGGRGQPERPAGHPRVLLAPPGPARSGGGEGPGALPSRGGFPAPPRAPGQRGCPQINPTPQRMMTTFTIKSSKLASLGEGAGGCSSEHQNLTVRIAIDLVPSLNITRGTSMRRSAESGDGLQAENRV